MNKIAYMKEAFSLMPSILVEEASGLHRHEIVNYLNGNMNIGIELGVASGLLSKRLLDSRKFSVLFGVDVYSDIHDTKEYKSAITTIGLKSNHKLLRLTFEDALDLFPDNFFDFVYVDGFAHTGEEGGKTLVDWYRKLKIGGIMSGDDYHRDWPLVMWAVNHFASQLGAKVTLTDCVQEERYSLYPTWFFKKERGTDESTVSLDQRLVEIAKKERKRIHKLRTSPIVRLKRATLKRIKQLILPQGK